MDPYDVLGVSRNATQDEIKKAYRREAMKWHPDRSDNSEEARERFHQAAEAYRMLSAHRQRPGNGGSDTYYDDPREAGAAEDEFADTVFWNVMLDYAIKMAQSGMSEDEITVALRVNGCPDRLAHVIADKAFNIHAHYAGSTQGKRGGGHRKSPFNSESSFKQERLETEMFRAFIGDRSLVWSPRDVIEYYLAIFTDFSRSAKLNPLAWIRPNKRLLKILNFAIVMFAALAVAINFYPGPSKYKVLQDMEMLQLPFVILALMFVWMMFRKLWLFTALMLLVYLVALAFSNANLPRAIGHDLGATLLIGAICFAPFVLAALFANFVYYLKAQFMISAAQRLFNEQTDKLVWIRNRAGTSGTAAFVFLLVFGATLVLFTPWQQPVMDSIDLEMPGIHFVEDDATARKIQQRLEQAGEIFDTAEAHFNRSPPDYVRAEVAYSTAADQGSLLAAYKLGYLYYVGEGVEQNDILAFDYFHQATKAPLAFQTHSLELTTRYLAESYNNLGIMYQSGQGTRRDLKKAREMYQRAVEFGSESARHNLNTLHKAFPGQQRRRLVAPEFR